MKSIKMLLIVALSIVSVSLHAQTSPKPKTTAKAATGVYYTCPMHTDYRSDKPGKCPKCGMTLVKKEGMMMDSTTSKKAPMKMKM